MFIVIDIANGLEYAVIVTDEEGLNQIFISKDDAQLLADKCQDGIVVEITTN